MEALGRVFEIGGTEQLTYLEMLLVAAELMNGRKIPVVPVPVLTPRLSSLWAAPGNALGRPSGSGAPFDGRAQAPARRHGQSEKRCG